MTANQRQNDAERAVPDARRDQHRPRTLEGLQRIVKARTVHGAYGAEMRELRGLMRVLDEEQRRVLELAAATAGCDAAALAIRLGTSRRRSPR
jgi:hypothetical protein